MAGLLLIALAFTIYYAYQSTDDPMREVPAVEADVNLEPSAGGTYIEGSIGFPDSLNPLLADTQAERDLATILFSGLVRVDGAGHAQPDLAESWDVSDDGLRYTFNLRPGVVWHDGEPVTATDVLFTLQLVQDPDFPGNPALSRFWRSVIAESVDEMTVEFQLLEQFSAFPAYAALPILPRHVLGGVIAQDLRSSDFGGSPIGTGPFRFLDASTDDSTISLEPHDEYFDDPPYVDSVEFRYFSDSDVLLEALHQGEIHGTGSLTSGQVLSPGVLPPDSKIYAPLMSGFTAVFFNLQSPLFGNVTVRTALELAIDREVIVAQVLANHVAMGSRPIHESSWAFAPPTVLRSDPSAAGDMLADAGWTDSDGDGVLDNGATRLSFPLLVNADDSQRTAVAEEVSRQLEAIGVQAVVQLVSSAEVSQALETRQFGAAIYGWHSPTGDPDGYQLWHSSQAEDGLNFTGLRHAEIDRLLEEGRTSSTIDERSSLYAEFQHVFAEHVPAIVLYYPRYHFVVSSSVHGVTPEPIVSPSDRMLGLTSWFLATEDDSADEDPS